MSLSIDPCVFGVLGAYLAERASFSERDYDIVRGAFFHRRLAAGEFLQRSGDVSRYAAFVAVGCLRHFVIDPKGKEHIVQFAPETWWLADSASLRTGVPSQYFFDAVEDSDLLLIDASGHHAFSRACPPSPSPSETACKNTPPRRICGSSVP